MVRLAVAARMAKAAEFARDIGDTVRLARAALGFAGEGAVTRWEVHTGVVEDAVVRLLEDALAADGLDEALRARLLARLSMEVYFSPLGERVAELSGTALQRSRGRRGTAKSSTSSCTSSRPRSGSGAARG